MSKVSCKFHPEANLIEDYRAGDQICSECGLVVGDRVIDVGSEWRTFSNDTGGEDRSRVGGPENSLLGSSDLSTMIGPGRMSGGAHGFSDSSAMYNNRAGRVSTSDRTLLNAFRQHNFEFCLALIEIYCRTISNMADRINLPKTITDRANQLFKMVADGKSLKGRSNDAIAAACLYIACRQEGVPRTFKEIVAVSTVSKKEIGRCFKLILKAHDTSVDLITTGDFMSRFCGTLSLPRNVQRGATTIAKKAVDLDIGNPNSSLRHLFIFISSAGKVSDFCGRRRHLHGQSGQRGQEDPEGDCRHRRGGGRHHQAELQADATQGRTALPSGLQVRHAH